MIGRLFYFVSLRCLSAQTMKTDSLAQIFASAADEIEIVLILFSTFSPRHTPKSDCLSSRLFTAAQINFLLFLKSRRIASDRWYDFVCVQLGSLCQAPRNEIELKSTSSWTHWWNGNKLFFPSSRSNSHDSLEKVFSSAVDGARSLLLPFHINRLLSFTRFLTRHAVDASIWGLATSLKDSELSKLTRCTHWHFSRNSKNRWHFLRNHENNIPDGAIKSPKFGCRNSNCKLLYRKSSSQPWIHLAISYASRLHIFMMSSFELVSSFHSHFLLRELFSLFSTALYHHLRFARDFRKYLNNLLLRFLKQFLAHADVLCAISGTFSIGRRKYSVKSPFVRSECRDNISQNMLGRMNEVSRLLSHKNHVEEARERSLDREEENNVSSKIWSSLSWSAGKCSENYFMIYAEIVKQHRFPWIKIVAFCDHRRVCSPIESNHRA